MEQVILREVPGEVTIVRPTHTVRITREVASGPPGPAGPAGAAGDREGFIFDQPTASTDWLIAHNLGYNPVVTVVDGDDEIMYADVKFVSTNLATVTFAYPTVGRAYLV